MKVEIPVVFIDRTQMPKIIAWYIIGTQETFADQIGVFFFLVGSLVKNLPANAGDSGLIPGSGRYTLNKGMATHFCILVWKIHGQGSLVGYNPRGRKESGTTEQWSTHANISCFL